MKISLYSYVTALMWGVVLALCIRVFRKRWRLTSPGNSLLLSFLYILCMLRMLLPLDISYSTGVKCRGFYSFAIDYLVLRKFPIFQWEISVFGLTCILLYGVSGIKLLKFLRNYGRAKRLFDGCLPYIHGDLDRINGRLERELSKIPRVRILASPAVQTPIAMGILKKIIVLPDLSYTEKELYYILQHEYAHFTRHDVALKLLSNLFACIFWWFPFAAFSRKDFAHITELGCDLQVCKGISMSEKIEYAQVLMATLKRMQEPALSPDFSAAVSFALREEEGNLKERFSLLLEQNPAPVNKTRQFVLSAFFAAVFLFSYRFMPIPSYDPDLAEIEQDGAIAITPESTYLIMIDNEYYAVVRGGEPDLIPEKVAEDLLKQKIPLKEDIVP